MSVADWGAGQYERTAALLLPAAEVLVAAAGVHAGEAVIDVGSGTGNVALLVAAAGASVTAVDPSSRLLTVAAAAAADRGLDVHFAEGDAASLGVADGSLDCLLSNFGVVFAPDAGAAVAEMSRVLRTDGRAVFTAWLPGGGLGSFTAAMQELVRDARKDATPPPRFAWHSPAALDERFSRHGMHAIVQGTHELIFRAASPEAYLEAELATHPMAIAALDVLRRQGLEAAARRQLLDVLRTHNEDPDAFQSTSRYVVVSARRGTA